MIVIGYQGIGKSTICKDNPRYIDFESSALKINGHSPYRGKRVSEIKDCSKYEARMKG